jgi:hypothetical protein
MTPAALLASLRAAGLTVRTNGVKVLVSPTSRLTPEQTDAIITHRAALLALLIDEMPSEEDVAKQEALNAVPHGFFDAPMELVRFPGDPPAWAAFPKDYLDLLSQWAAFEYALRQEPAKKNTGKKKAAPTNTTMFDEEPS